MKVFSSKRLIKLRTEAKLKQHELSTLSGISATTISRLESNKIGLPKPETLKALATALNCQPSFFVVDIRDKVNGLIANEINDCMSLIHQLIGSGKLKGFTIKLFQEGDVAEVHHTTILEK